MRVVDDLPFVPTMWTAASDAWGSPSARMSERMRARSRRMPKRTSASRAARAAAELRTERIEARLELGGLECEAARLLALGVHERGRCARDEALVGELAVGALAFVARRGEPLDEARAQRVREALATDVQRRVADRDRHRGASGRTVQ